MQNFTNMDKAKVRITLDHPFFASILLKYPLIETKSVETLAVDARGQIFYNENFTQSLSVPNLVWALSHEIGHKIYGHAQRQAGRDGNKWNYACDAVINDILNDAGVGEKIDGCVDMPGSKDKTAEQVYDELPDNPGGGGGSGSGGGNQPPGGIGPDLKSGDGNNNNEQLTPAEQSAVDAQNKIDMVQAANAAKAMGKLPASLKRMVEEYINVKTPWYDILERFLTEKAKNEQTWNRPNRRYIGQDIYLPSADSTNQMGELVIGIDTSGSIGQKELDHFGGHVNRILETTSPEKVTVVYCDARVNHVDVYLREDYPIKLVPHGGGGTDFKPVFDYVTENAIDPAAIIYLTDGYGDFPKNEIAPTIWAMTTSVKAPMGETIYVDGGM